MDEAKVKRFTDVCRLIHDLETKNVAKNYRMKNDQYFDVQQTVNVMQKDYEAALLRVKAFLIA